MQRILLIVVLWATTWVLPAGEALAQFGGDLPLPIVALESATVRKELKLSEKQQADISIILEKLQADLKAIRSGAVPGLQPLKKRVEQANSLLKAMSLKQKDANGVAMLLLTDEQKSRVNQICIWLDKGSLFRNEVVKELELTEEQKGDMSAAYRSLELEMQQVRNNPVQPGGKADDAQKEISAQQSRLQTEIERRSIAILTDQQRARFDKMRGPRFEVDLVEIPTISGVRPAKIPNPDKP